MKHTGKSWSEALIFASTNPQYEKRLFIELRVQDMKIASSEHKLFLFWHSEQLMNTFCGIIDARISASEKDLPLPQ